jgi:hypothetical protein
MSAYHLSSLIILPVWLQPFAMTAWRRSLPGSGDPVLTQTFVVYGPRSVTLFTGGGGGGLGLACKMTLLSVGGGGVGIARKVTFFMGVEAAGIRVFGDRDDVVLGGLRSVGFWP